MVSVTSKKKATQKKAAAAAAKRGGKTAAVVASSKATEAHNGVDKVANGIRAFQISDRTCTGVLCSHPLSRDIHVSLLGGQVTSWRNEKGEELLFTSSKFGNRGSQEQHGFARNKLWTIEENTPDLLCIACMSYRDNS